MTEAGGPLEKFKNSYQNTTGGDPILLLTSGNGDLTDDTVCNSTNTPRASGALDNGNAMTSDPTDYKGLLVIRRHTATDNLSKTDHQLQIGYCDGESKYQEISDNVSF